MATALVAYFSATGTTGIVATALAEAAGAEFTEGKILNGEWSKDELRDIIKQFMRG